MRRVCITILQLAMMLFAAVVVYEKHIGSVADAEQFTSDCRCQRRG